MKVFTDLAQWKLFRATDACFYQSIGLVATMGNLHAGHATLLDRCAEQNLVRVLTIFVNPLQFSDAADLLSYPKTLERDLDLARDHRVSFVLAPSAEQMYPHRSMMQVVHRSSLSTVLEGGFRPGHFDGVLTVVTKLFGLIRPNKAYFGEKDFQQLLLVRQLVIDLCLPIEILSVPVVRENSGLALSSRNSKLSPANRLKAAALFDLLQQKQLYCPQIKEALLQQGFLVDYVEEKWQRRLAAVTLQSVRLIDNVPLD